MRCWRIVTPWLWRCEVMLWPVRLWPLDFTSRAWKSSMIVSSVWVVLPTHTRHVTSTSKHDFLKKVVASILRPKGNSRLHSKAQRALYWLHWLWTTLFFLITSEASRVPFASCPYLNCLNRKAGMSMDAPLEAEAFVGREMQGWCRNVFLSLYLWPRAKASL